ncbi:MAG: LysM peptidoglycan-binding domain-containing protein [Anaerolineae bacterium]|nr:LysM peptidoglycan-binding domain-containing protein [Anaerolineae bacterium]
MIRRLWIGTLLVSLLLPGLAQAQGSAGDLLGRINALRASMGLPGYSLNGALSAAAQSQAQWMADTGTVSHVRPDGSGPRTRAVNAGYGSTDVSENIYGGTNATVDAAWLFWINSGVHYRGLVNNRYQEVGIGIASTSWGNTFVLVFGNPGGPQPFVPPASSGAASGPAAPPSFIKGVDEHGFIMHEIQPEDTLGDIALLYGYTWDDIPYMKQVNNLADHRSLQAGEIFLVPPHDGTYTPTPGGEAVADAATAAPDQPDESTVTPQPTDPPTATPPPTFAGIATSAAMPEVLALPPGPTASLAPQAVAVVSTEVVPVLAGSTISRSGPSPWLGIALVLQVGLLIVAGAEFMRRTRRRSK